VLSNDLLLVTRHGGVWTGTDGLLAQDQMQHLAWVRDAANHGLASNLYVTEPRPHDYIQPLVAISAVLTALGMATWLSVLLWKPVAVVALFISVRAVVLRTVDGDRGRMAALALALLFTGWTLILAHLVELRGFTWRASTNEIWLPFGTWGYPFAVISLAAMVGALCCYAEDRRARRVGLIAPLLGALSAWVHPWQGQTLILILVGSEALRLRDRGRARGAALGLTVGMTALPLAYYVVLGRVDSSWDLAQEAGHRTWSLPVILVVLAPLLLLALPAYRLGPRGFLDTAVRVWPFAILAVFLAGELPQASGALHALLGVTIPLSILSVQGVASLRLRPISVAPLTLLLALAVGPPIYEQLRSARSVLKTSYNSTFDGTFITGGEDDALDWLADAPRPGAVLTRTYLGSVVPARTGRATWVGNQYWTPDAFGRAATANALFAGGVTEAAGRRIVSGSGATFVLVDCASRSPQLGALSGQVHRFGCARIVELRRADP
jgi:hypothetical protein